METKRFQRTKEDFECAHCGRRVVGNGYTNHCPQCIWSRHVDKLPGDRASECCGMMAPVAIEVKGGENFILHRCEVCGFERRQRQAPEDNFEAILIAGQLLGLVAKRADSLKRIPF